MTGSGDRNRATPADGGARTPGDGVASPAGGAAVPAGGGAHAPADGAAAAPGWVKSARQVERERLRRRRTARSGSIATASTVLVIVLLLWAFTASPGWPRVRETFFDPGQFVSALPDVLSGFLLNIKIFLIAEPLILVLGLLVALARNLRAPVFFPLRALAVAYTDVFRGVPTILIIYLVGFGLPALGLQGTPTDLATLGVIALTLSYGAYVAEVFRAGIDSVHPSQVAAARSLGLSHGKAMRYVVVPQAVRRVVPPLLNDFVSLQKDTALVATIGPLEALRQAQIHVASTFNYTPYLAAALLFIVLTIPMARFTDYLAARSQRRRGQ
ncbi:amino acid ABC transporter permease [Streptosporangium sandarakinum]|uniref:Polar amino acid transport system permease protein n=1 Tax=Streptosporangium sandarakinum TaxID=1260955 RepID=A0A852UZN8_9ACTN|nr:amino acid ABC transporter permease [Streptosporangium sandarakinum]NYF41146.1 polar amino acid transport system permease protein [Streptosporangium sandarakinum]